MAGLQRRGSAVALKMEFGGPKGSARIIDFNALVFVDWTSELEIEVIADPQVALFKRSIEHTPPEADRFHRDRVTAGFDVDSFASRKTKLAVGADKVQVCTGAGSGGFVVIKVSSKMRGERMRN